jgi:hypothetical protein
MTAPTASTARVLAILDADFGDRLRDIPPGQPVWITMSLANEPAVRSLWATRSDPDHLTGITSMNFTPGLVVEDQLLNNLGTIDLRHGPYSSKTPYTELEVIGSPLTPRIRAALSKFGFIQFDERQHSFIASRSQAADALLRP